MINIKDILDQLYIEYKSISSTEVRAKCWNPNHVDAVPSLNINLETGIYHCFGCHIKGNILTLVQDNLNIGHWEARKVLSQFSKGGLTREDKLQKLTEHIKERQKPLPQRNSPIEIPKFVPAINHPYLINRNITEEERNKWNIGVVKEISNPAFFGYNNWIIFPIYYKNILRTYFVRSTKGSNKRFGKYKRDDIIFGLEDCINYNEYLFLVEGIFDMIALRKAQVQVASLLSNRILPKQIEQLKQYKNIVLVPDNDDGGMYILNDAMALLNYCNISYSPIPNNKNDPGSCNLEELIEITLNHIPLVDKIVSKEFMLWYTTKFTRR